MKRLTMAAVMVMALMFSGSAMAGGTSVYVGGGLSMPSGDWSDLYKTGFGGVVGIGFQVSPKMEVGVRIAYTSFSIDDLGTGLIDGGEVVPMDFLGHFKFYLGAAESKFKPYVTGAVGLTQFKVKPISVLGITLTEEWTETPLTFGGGSGFDYMFSPTTGLWVEAKYVIISTEGGSTNYIPFGFGIKFMFGGE